MNTFRSVFGFLNFFFFFCVLGSPFSLIAIVPMRLKEVRAQKKNWVCDARGSFSKLLYSNRNAHVLRMLIESAFSSSCTWARSMPSID